MQKILIALAGFVLVGVFFFIQNSEKKEKVTKDPIQKEVLKETSKQTTQHVSKENSQSRPNTKINKPFTSSISPLGDTPDKPFTDEDKKAIESKSDITLQKEIFADIQSRLTTEMQSIPNCLENAQNKKEALACSNELHEIHKEFELILGIVTDDSIQNDTSGFVWNESTKENMIKELDASIEPMQSMFSCLQSADDNAEQEKCFEIDETK
ncbi:hypothetical protein MNB_SV-5-1265 [hydrothermal vent metagenome]|uniref:Uncharacterized protein n=1 Tax=hydrothermal vent metagenome TaxID=652676 RepID=A0A1W1ED18_9ZZZZ